MQVKKFEAKTMKEALDLVKTQLGPDAIILSARDIRKGQGLAGASSVEITAAISDEALQRLKFFESRMPAQTREKIGKASVKTQRTAIDRMVANYQSDLTTSQRGRRYAEIEDAPVEARIVSHEGSSSSMVDETAPIRGSADTRIKNAAQRAWSALQSAGGWKNDAGPRRSFEEAKSTIASAASVFAQNSQPQDQEVQALRSELVELKKVLSDFQKVPQSLVNSYPGARYGLNHDMSAPFERLLTEGMTEDLAAEILLEAQTQLPPVKHKNRGVIEGWLAKYILDNTQTSSALGNQIQIFLGPAGLGKTTSLIKLASRLVVEKNKRVALVTCDTGKVGAVEQMRIFAQILNVPFAVMRSPTEWTAIRQKLSSCDFILVDFPAWSLKSIQEISLAKAWLAPTLGARTVHLVLSSLIRTSDLLSIGKSYSVLPISDVIFTGLDQAASYGNIFQFELATRWPLHSFGTGPRVPEDFELATKERMVDLVLRLSKIKKQGNENG